jgi:hypothetical protein
MLLLEANFRGGPVALALSARSLGLQSGLMLKHVAALVRGRGFESAKAKAEGSVFRLWRVRSSAGRAAACESLWNRAYWQSGRVEGKSLFLLPESWAGSCRVFQRRPVEVLASKAGCFGCRGDKAQHHGWKRWADSGWS